MEGKNGPTIPFYPNALPFFHLVGLRSQFLAIALGLRGFRVVIWDLPSLLFAQLLHLFEPPSPIIYLIPTFSFLFLFLSVLVGLSNPVDHLSSFVAILFSMNSAPLYQKGFDLFRCIDDAMGRP